MDLSFIFFFNSIVLGIGLAMDAFSVSLANGMNEPCMKKKKMLFIALVFAIYLLSDKENILLAFKKLFKKISKVNIYNETVKVRVLRKVNGKIVLIKGDYFDFKNIVIDMCDEFYKVID